MKYSVSSKYNMEILTIRLQKNEQLVQNEIGWINSQQLSGIIPVQIEDKGSSYILNYNVTGFIPLKKYVKNRINSNDFAVLLDSFSKSLQKLQEAGLSFTKLLLEDKSVYINPVSKRFEFIYVPIDFYDNMSYVEKFLRELAKNLRFDRKENTQFLQEFNQMIAVDGMFSCEQLDGYVKHLKEMSMQKYNQNRNNAMQNNAMRNGAVNNAMQNYVMQNNAVNNAVQNGAAGAQQPSVGGMSFVFCVSCGHKNTINSRFCVKCGKPIKAGQGSQEPAKPAVPPQEIQPPVYGSKEPPFKEAAADYDEDEESATSVLSRYDDDDSEEATSVLSAVKIPRIVYPYLIREKTQEKIQVDKVSYVIGKGKASDYMITGNNAISRSHVTVITRGSQYFISDNHSTNMTFIGEEELEPEQEYEVFSGTKIKLADEEFTLYVPD